MSFSPCIKLCEGTLSVMMRRLVFAAAGLALATAVAAVVALYLSNSGLREAAKNATAPAIGGPFSLIDHTGRGVTEADYRGKLMVVYFGYTFCPDVCPTGLYKIAQALDALGEDANGVHPLFITVDPERDTTAVMKDYVANFHPDLVGLSGSLEQIGATTKAYRVYVAKAEPEAGAAADEYLVDHTAITYVMGRDGGFRQALSHGSSVEEITAAIRKALDDRS